MPLARLYIGPGRSHDRKKTPVENVTKAIEDSLGALRHPVLRALALVMAFGLACAAVAAASDYPTRPIRIVVPFPPGGATDVLARIIGQKMTEDWSQQIVIDNRPGASGLLGADIVANANPDGHTVLMTALGGITLDNLKSFAPVILVAAPPSVLVVHPSVKATTAKELIALARAQPGKLNFGSSGTGSQSHLASELMKSMAKIDVVHIPYKGAGQAVAELLGGQVQFMMAPLPAVQSQIKAGKLRALAVTSLKRFGPAPELPTLDETGLTGYEAIGWFGMLAPVRVGKEIVAKLNSEANRILALPDTKERMFTLGAEPVGGTVEQFARYIKADTEKWAKVIKEAGIKVE